MVRFIRPVYNFVRTQKALRKYFPVRCVQIEITTYCNLKCKGCYHNIKDYPGKNKHMPLEDFKMYVDQMPKVDDLKIYGKGEPTLHPDIMEIVEYADKSNKFNDIIISTNCLACKPSFFGELFKKGLTRIIISVDSMIQEEANELRYGTDIEKLKHNIECLLTNHYREVGFAVVVSKTNYPTIEKTVEILDDLGAKKISISIFSNLNGFKHLVLSSDEKIDLVRKVKQVRTKNAEIVVGRYLFQQDKPCDVIFTRAVISVNGHLVPCITDMDENIYSVGCLKEETFTELFFSNRYGLIQDKMNKGMYPPVCKGCCKNHTEYKYDCGLQKILQTK